MILFDKGFVFRSTSGYITDAPGDTYVLADAFPTVRDGVTFGYVSLASLEPRNRTLAWGSRFAGLHFGSSNVFRVTLPKAGTYLIRFGFADFVGGVTICNVHFCDVDTVRAEIPRTVLATGLRQIVDAAGSVFGSASGSDGNAVIPWHERNAAIAINMTTTDFRMKMLRTLGDPPSGAFSYLRITEVASGGVARPSNPFTQQVIG